MNPNNDIMSKIIAVIRAIPRVICIVIFVLGVLVLTRSAVNAYFLYSYDRGKYPTMLEYTMLSFPFGENYVIPYNLGNAYFQNGDYDKAVSFYMEALSKDPPERDEECMIRVNLAFSLCHTIDFDHLDPSDQEAVSNAINILLQARYVLTEHECASEPVGSDDGHFRDADLLKHDIDKMLQQLQSRSDSNEDGQGGGGDGDDDQDKDGGEGDDQSKDQEQDPSQTRSGKPTQEQEKEERARQEDLKEDLEKQKGELREGGSSSSYDYEYIDGGDAQGYGEGTLW